MSHGPVPDILDVFSPDMITEEASFDVSSLQQEVIELEKAPKDMAFNLYKHMRCWQSTWTHYLPAWLFTTVSKLFTTLRCDIATYFYSPGLKSSGGYCSSH